MTTHVSKHFILTANGMTTCVTGLIADFQLNERALKPPRLRIPRSALKTASLQKYVGKKDRKILEFVFTKPKIVKMISLF